MQSVFSEIFSLLVIAVLLVWIFKRINLPPILAYLATGLIAGPYALGWITDYQEIHLVAEFGIVFLLFSLGLEFSIPKLVAMRHVVFGLGTAQVLISTFLLMLVAIMFGTSWLSAFSIASLLTLSSTAIVVKQLSESGELHTRRGQLAIGILLFQDIAVVPLLIALPLLAGSGDQHLLIALLIALGKGALVCGLLWGIGKWILPRIFNEVAEVRTDELFVLTTLLVTLFASALTHFFGLSMALGAFLAGIMLGESQYRHQLEADIRPFRDILMGLFFVTVGMQLDMTFVLMNASWVILGLLGLILIKCLVIKLLARFMGESHKDSWSTGLMLCQMGEFGFVLIALALQHELIASSYASLLIAVGVLSMAVTPYLVDNNQKIARLLSHSEKNKQSNNENPTFKSELENHVVICGFGRVGQTVARFLKTEAIPYIALDVDPVRIREAQAAGENVHFGHVKHKEVLKAAGIANSRLVIITFADFDKSMTIINVIKQIADKVKILVRMKDDSHLGELKDAGVTEVVPESLEASLMLVSHVLFMSGVPVKRILRRVQQERKNRYGLLHGYFPGENSDIASSSSERLEYLHAVALTDDAFAISKTLEQLALDKKRVDVMGLRREGREISQPLPGMILQCQDILVIRGKPRQVERVERYLLEGD
ncbi:monovalent cation:proton antiporter family protein [Pseudoalteromonas denitrificans]|uniref:Kef-type potassium/proton antiporter, CPA2 family n=1 Tax=Pseudoalteromonas denitrificans DSM 6059 TaxID=1123010 RepID=A0A1I1H9T4_9GAMM|nr:monovalent cation:proton antiporter family protein [Pseudoalteromonas denitrificans]SFC20526.1 Kef-type potassium/proton antiporter, CPA2 family [Pseudoalteromonas denitrificans DSM 6059]